MNILLFIISSYSTRDCQWIWCIYCNHTKTYKQHTEKKNDTNRYCISNLVNYPYRKKTNILLDKSNILRLPVYNRFVTIHNIVCDYVITSTISNVIFNSIKFSCWYPSHDQQLLFIPFLRSVSKRFILVQEKKNRKYVTTHISTTFTSIHIIHYNQTCKEIHSGNFSDL